MSRARPIMSPRPLAAGLAVASLVASATLQQPGGIELGRDGTLYVTNKTATPGGGEVVRVVP